MTAGGVERASALRARRGVAPARAVAVGLGAATAVAALALGCTVGDGEGDVTSDRLFVAECWNGPFDLQPTFFAANPYRQSDVLFRIQRGDEVTEVSDGLTLVVEGVDELRQTSLGVRIPVGLPRGVSPPGVPLADNPDAPRVSLALYLHKSCHRVNATVYSLTDAGGWIVFDSLFSGDPNEDDAADRLTTATFDAVFADPRDLGADGEVPADRRSRVTGTFRFYFQRGQPAQPFP